LKRINDEAQRDIYKVPTRVGVKMRNSIIDRKFQYCPHAPRNSANTRDYVHETIAEFEIPVEKDKNGDDENGETLALRIFLHDDKDAFQQGL
jgi:hypothetical protein